ncbi:50S ribosomal protein L22 [Niabella ginsenosidivorans]|uniref:Large ribosomal subunit protein uL22 n=2 Tax=Niabella ginsenosidivorans TaxID=1176587 RepID=A0A1A9I122_9BACT|nr:50S ribosomal protein L22 [Niabella ginsenosidivorans]
MEAVAKLRNYPTSPRKMRLLADLIRGQKVDLVLAELEHNPKHPAVPLRKLVLSAIVNWKQANEGADESGLVVKTIYVDGGRTLKRMRPAPQGRGYRVRKRSNHVTLVVDVAGEDKKAAKKAKAVAKKEEAPKAPVKKKAAAKKSTKESKKA